MASFGGEGSMAGGFFSSAMDIVNQKVAQEYRSQDRAQEQDYNSYMSNTAVSRRKADMEAAGINPILAAGSPASGGGGSPSPGGYGGSTSFGAGVQAAARAALVDSEVAVNTANAEKSRAEAETERNRPENVRADTELKGGQTSELAQRVRQSVVEIDKIRADTDLSRSTAATQFESMKKIQAEVRQIEAVIGQVRAMTEKAKSETAEVSQRVKANLPAITAKLGELQAVLDKLKQPEAMNQAGLHSTYLGALSTLLKGLSPLVR